MKQNYYYKRMMTDLLLIKITPVGLNFKEMIKENTVALNKPYSKCSIDQNP